MPRETMNIRWVPFSMNQNVASLRLRCVLPAKWLASHGHAVEISRRPNAEGADVVVFSKCYDEVARSSAERFRSSGSKVLLDLCDNHFFSDVEGATFHERKANLISMIGTCDAVVTASEQLASVVRAEVANAPAIFCVPDPLEDLNELAAAAPFRDWMHWPRWLKWKASILARRKEGAVGLVWFGNHGVNYSKNGGMTDLLRLRDIIESMGRSHRVYLSVVSNSRQRFLEVTRGWRVDTFYLPWSSRFFAPALRLNDISVIPIDQNPFTCSKTANRLALSLSEGLAVVADSIPSYEPYSDVTRLNCWEQGLSDYIGRADLRLRDAELGRERVRRDFSMERIGMAWQRVLQQVSSISH
jgi:hypothetical protein